MINLTDSSNRKQGFWKLLNPSSGGHAEFFYKDDKFIGKFKEFLNDGFQWYERNYPKGIMKMYYLEKNLQDQCYFSDGENRIKHGIRIINKENE